MKIRLRQIQRAAAFDESLLIDLKKVLGSLGVYLAFNEIIFQKVLHVVAACQDQCPQLHPAIMQLVNEVFLPANALVSPNPAIEDAVWTILRHSDHNQRYISYTNILKAT